MKHFASLAALGAVMTMFTFASPAYADGWERSRTVIGPYGGKRTFESRGSCEHGSCSSEQRWTGPRGRTVTRRGSTSCYGGECSGSAEWSGPRGTTSVKRRFQRY